MRHIVTLVVCLIVGVGVVGGINYRYMNSWFGKSGPANIGSIEVSYVTMAKMLVEYGGGSWVPNWYAGFPVNLIYTPLVPVVEAVLLGEGQVARIE
jgi:uncharacterized membrane protein